MSSPEATRSPPEATRSAPEATRSAPEATRSAPEAVKGAHEPVLRVKNLVVRYGERTVLDGVDLTVGQGEVWVILGGSGCGKSTLVKGILGLAEASSGSVEMLGQDLSLLHDEERSRLYKRVGMLFQNGALFGSLTVAQNVALPLQEFAKVPESVVRELVRMKLNLVSMGHAEHFYPSELSGGMKKRVALARAMILDPEILFCDEPSAGLDPLTSAELDQLILQLKNLFKMTVVVVTHELASIETIADSVIMLGKGKVIAAGPIAEVRSRGIQEVDDFFSRRLEPGVHEEKSVAELFGLNASVKTEKT